MKQITGADLFMKALKEEAVDTLFAYPGGQAIDLFNALYGEKEIDVILPRHEQGLIHAADGYARSTGKVGVCLVTSGPGATNLVTGIATANYDSVPLVCFTGQVPTHLIGNDTFQEVDFVGITRSICKYAVMVRKREDLAETIKKAFYIAKTGKPGVVVVDLPKDVQRAYGSDLYPKEIMVRGYKPKLSVHMGQLNKALEVLNHAVKPVFLIGGGVNIAHANKEMTQLAELTGVPVITTIMGKGAIPTTNSLYVGNIGIHGSYAANHAVSECDVLFSIGTRFNDRITGKITEHNFSMLSDKYQKEQDGLTKTIDTLQKQLEQETQKTTDAEKWISLIKQYTYPVELTAELLNAFIEKILVHEAVTDEHGDRVQKVEIFYRFIGRID